MSLIFADIETDGLDPTVIHLAHVENFDGLERTFFDMEQFKQFCLINKDARWVFQNGLGFDVWVINKLVGKGCINPLKVIDTAVVSRLVDYHAFNTHSLEELGQFVGEPKGKYEGDFKYLTGGMIDYCIQDVKVLKKIYKHFEKYIKDPAWAKAMRVEHDMAIISNDMHYNGFSFDKSGAETLLASVRTEMTELEESMQKAFPPRLEEVNRLQYRVKKDGTLFSSVEEAHSRYPLTKVEGDVLVCFDYKEFSPASARDRIDALWDAGWKPYVKTKGHKKMLRDKK